MKKVASTLILICVSSAAAFIVGRGGSSRPEDCIPYNASALQIVDEGEKGWLLTDGRSRLQGLDNKEDAEAALSLAQQHNYQCFIGRNNRRPDRLHYILEYWK